MRFLRSIGYYGLVELEYKYDERDGLTKLLDVNARTWGYHSLGSAPASTSRTCCTRTSGAAGPERSRARPGISWIRLATDIPTAAGELARRRLGWRSYLRSLRVSDVESVFSPTICVPGFAELALLPYLAVKRGI